MVYEHVDWIQVRTQCQVLFNAVLNLARSIYYGVFLDYLSDYYPLKDSAARICGSKVLKAPTLPVLFSL
jgi:hypothetical protein